MYDSYETIIKEYVSKMIVDKDKSKENILRKILFNSPIDWVQVKEIIQEERPETFKELD